MRRIYKYIMLAAFSFAVASCINEELTPDAPSAESGDEVQFGLSLGDPETKTIYGVEAGNAFPIYWVNGDKVRIFSPQCLDGRRSAEYQVAVSGAEQNYADRLTKTGESGLQWSKWGDNSNEFYDFYSLYPSGNYTLSNDGTNAENIVINYNQNVIVNGNVIKSDMEDCLMYAKANDVEKGDVVNLTYDPISTVVYVTLKVAKGTGTSTTEYTIQSVSLLADKDIAGTFSLNISNGEFVEYAKGNSSSTVLAQITNASTGGFHTISNGESLSVPLFLAPISGLNVKNWKLQVVANNITYTKTLNIDKTLKPGEIHKITLPELPIANQNWNTDNWMTNIPRNVYLSEVSIPGSWNSLNEEFQGTNPSVSSQYTNGARAFHLDTRWQGGGSALRPTIKNVLGVADGGNTVEYTNNGRVMTDTDNPSVEDALDEMIENIKGDEYMLLICTFAQGSHNHMYTLNDITYDWIGEISRICALKDEVYDAKELTSNTLVGDVLGKVIVIINTEDEVSSVPASSKCLFVNVPMVLKSNLFGKELNSGNKVGIYKGSKDSQTISDTGIDIYNTQAQVCIAGETYNSTRDRSNVDGRGFAPTFGERKTVANNILTWSKNNYKNTSYAHDKWIYLGIGGYYVEWSDGFFGIGAGWRAASNAHSNVAENFNGWINDKVTEMGKTPSDQTSVVPYYPVGIVLMNFINSYSSTAKNILLLNNKYGMQFDPQKPTDYNPNARTTSAAASYSSGMHDQNVAAFGWD